MNKPDKIDRQTIQQEQKDGVESLSNALRFSIVFLYALAILMLLVIASQSFLTVKQHEVGLIYRFGKLRAVVRTGLHFTWPYPIEESVTYEVTRPKKLETSNFLAAPTETMPTSLNPEIDGYVLTGDTNIVHIKCLLTYYISTKTDDAIINYFVKTVDAKKELQALVDNAILKAASELSADDILFDVEKLRSNVASSLRQSISEANLGVYFESKDISLKTEAPAQTKTAFTALTQASHVQDKLKNEALTYKIKIENEAQTLAQLITADAKSEQLRKVSAAQADAQTFSELLKQYRQNSDLIQKTIYEEAMFKVFKDVDEKFVIRKSKKGEIRVLFSRNLDKGGK